MASQAMDYEANGGYDDEAPRYDRDNRSASPRARDENDSGRRRSVSPGTNPDIGVKDETGSKEDGDGSINPGSNLFVTGIHPRLTEAEVTRLFEKYGEVEKCQIMRDPHTKESRGFGFVKMYTLEQADAAKDGLQGEQIEGRTLSIEKARRARPRTPTPGKYFGPPKRDPRGRYGDRYDERSRRGGGYGGPGGYRDDPYRYRGGGGGSGGSGGGGGYDRRYDDRGYDRGYREDRGYERGPYREDRGYDRRDRDDGYGRPERYAAREDRERFDRRGGAGYDRERYDRPERYDRERYDRDRYDRPEREAPRPRDAPGSAPAYSDAPPRGADAPREGY